MQIDFFFNLNPTMQSAIVRSFQFFEVAEIKNARSLTSVQVTLLQLVYVDSPKKKCISFAGLVTGIQFHAVMIRLALS